jgi:hypothetical protein
MVHIKVPHFTSYFNKILETDISNYYLLIWKVWVIFIMWNFTPPRHLHQKKCTDDAKLKKLLHIKVDQ